MARILVTDDESNIRMMVQLALEQVGHMVDSASDGVSALDVYGDGSAYDIVLLDQRMPGMEGLDVLREMRLRNPDARVIMVTAFGTIDLAVDAMKAGATDFLRKPFTIETLRGSVESALAAMRGDEAGDGSESSPILYGLTTINGFHIESNPADVVSDGGDIQHAFKVRLPGGNDEDCQVVIAGHVVEAVKSHTRREDMPVEDRLWHALSEHTLSNYLWQRAELPQGNQLRIDDFDRALRKWVDTAIHV